MWFYVCFLIAHNVPVPVPFLFHSVLLQLIDQLVCLRPDSAYSETSPILTDFGLQATKGRLRPARNHCLVTSHLFIVHCVRMALFWSHADVRPWKIHSENIGGNVLHRPFYVAC